MHVCHDDSGYEKPTNYKEDINPYVATREECVLCVIRDDQQNRDGTQTIYLWSILSCCGQMLF